MENRINSFEDLNAWKWARALVRSVYAIFRRPPAGGDFGSLSFVMLDAEYISDTEHSELLELVTETGRLVSGLMRSTRARIEAP